MASAYKKRKTWYVKFRDVHGFKSIATKATTKTEAKRLGEELERKAERQRLGIEAVPANDGQTLGQLCEWWLKERCPAASIAKERSRLTRWVIEQPIGKTPLLAVSAARLDAHLRQAERAGLSPNSVNRLRAILHGVYAQAIKAEIRVGSNPVSRVERRKVPRRAYVTLRAEEVPLFLANVPDHLQDLFVTALWTAMRKGELLGLKKTNVDLRHRTITVAASYDSDRTKGGHAEVLPIADQLVPHLRRAIEQAPGDLVFPDAKGGMRSRHTKLEQVLRRALGRAGIVDGYEHVCRRCKGKGEAEHTWRFPEAIERRCPNCNMRLWPKPVPRHMRFHDLRHTTGTLLTRAGVPARHVQRILRHADLRTTDVYTHLEVDDLRAAVNTIGTDAASASNTGPNATRLLPAAPETPQAALSGPKNSPEIAALSQRAWQESNLRPSDSKSDALSS